MHQIQNNQLRGVGLAGPLPHHHGQVSVERVVAADQKIVLGAVALWTPAVL
jgi:hypothetical protein